MKVAGLILQTMQHQLAPMMNISRLRKRYNWRPFTSAARNTRRIALQLTLLDAL